MINNTEYDLVEKYNIISQQFTKYVGTCLYSLCLFGTLMNILTFSQRTYTRRTCSIYLLLASICDLIQINLGPLSNILQYGFHYDWTITSIIYCKIKSYLVYILTIISGTLIIFSTISQYMLSSKKTKQWTYSYRIIDIRCIIFIILFWSIVSIPILYCVEHFSYSLDNEQMICINSCRSQLCFLVQLIYICLLNGVIPPFLMMIFGILTYRNVHQVYQRSQLKSARIRKINEQLAKMLIFQAIKSTCVSIPYSIFNCYWIITVDKEKLLIERTKENLIHQIVYLLFCSNYTSFFVYIYSSIIFRNQWNKVMKQIFCCPRKKIKD